MELRLKRQPRPDLVERVGPIVEKTGLFKLPLGDPWREAEERETYPHLLQDIVIPSLSAATACYLFPPRKGIQSNVKDFFEPIEARRGAVLLKKEAARMIGTLKEFWYLDSEVRGEICFALPAASAGTDRIYAGAYSPSGFLNVGTVLSRRAVNFARQLTTEKGTLCAFLAEVGFAKRLFVFGPKNEIRTEWLRALVAAKCDRRMRAEFFIEAG